VAEHQVDTPLTASRDGGQPHFRLPAHVTIETVESVLLELQEMDLSDEFILDATQVEIITTPGLQLLVSLEKTLSIQGGALVISGTAQPFVHALRDAGLESLLDASS